MRVCSQKKKQLVHTIRVLTSSAVLFVGGRQIEQGLAGDGLANSSLTIAPMVSSVARERLHNEIGELCSAWSTLSLENVRRIDEAGSSKRQTGSMPSVRWLTCIGMCRGKKHEPRECLEKIQNQEQEMRLFNCQRVSKECLRCLSAAGVRLQDTQDAEGCR